MRTRLFMFAFLTVVVRCQPAVPPDEREAGLPFLHNYAPRQYGAQAQNWAITQDQRGVMYFGNNDGVVVYDGVRWQTIRVANNSPVRSLDVDANGTVYVGALAEFGYLASDRDGALRYVSLVDQVAVGDRKFNDVSKTIVTPRGVFFSTYERLFRWSAQGGVKVWKPSARRFHWAFLAGGAIYVQQPSAGGGLLRLDENEKLQLVSGSERFATDRIYCVTQRGSSILVGAANGGMFLEEAGAFVPFPTEVDTLLRESQPYSCATLPDGGLVVSTIQSGAILISHEGKLQRILDRDAGLPSETVTFAYSDREGGLWLALESGLSRVQAPSPLSFFDERLGLKGATRAIVRHGDSLYAGTTTGLYRLVASTSGVVARFEPVGTMKESVRALLSTELGLLVGSSSGVYQLEKNQLRLVRASQSVYDIVRSRRDPELAYVAGRNGLALLSKNGARWSDSGKIGGVNQSVRRPVETPAGIWLGTDAEGAIWIDDSKDPPEVTVFGAKKDGLPTGYVYPASAPGRVVFLTDAGILAFDEKARRFSPDALLDPMFAETSDKPSILMEDSHGYLWAGAKTYGGQMRLQPDGKYKWDPKPLRRMSIAEIYAANVDSDDVAWAGTTEGIVRYNPAIPKDYAVRSPALVRQVRVIGAKDALFGGAGQPPQLQLPYKANSLRFEFASPAFEDESRTEFRVRLEGFDPGWSQWTTDARKEYTNLPEGSYTFHVEARNLYGVTGAPAAYAMTVLAPWYRSRWGYLLEALAAAALLWGVVQWRLRLLAEQNRRLQKTVDERTAELRDNNGKLVDANTTLNALNAEKNEFMGIAAHDLKNPLGAIRGYAEMLEEDAHEVSKDEVADMAARIKKSANLMFDLVSNLLDVNRIEQGKLDVNIEPCDLWEALRLASEGYRQRATVKQIQLHFDEQTHPAPALADPVQLTQVIDNLVSNAVKYSPPGKSVYLSAREVQGSVRIEVRDEGPGISAEDRKRLFSKFARLSAKPTAGEHSTGLGLAIAKKLVESMHGSVWCESEPGDGATFILELPLAGAQVLAASGPSK